MKNEEILAQYVPFVDFLGKALGSQYEIVLHDFHNPEASVIAIANGHLSHRTLGSPMTNLLLRALQSKDGADSMTNYEAISTEGKRFHSSTFFIKNSRNQRIGAMCINFDASLLETVHMHLGRVLHFANQAPQIEEPKEGLYKNLEETLRQMLSGILVQNHLHVDTLSPEEKQYVIAQLALAGAFRFKGSVGEMARLMKLSEPTIYRYLAQVKKEQQQK